MSMIYSTPAFLVATVLVLIFVYAVKKLAKKETKTALSTPVAVSVPVSVPALIPGTNTLPTVYNHVNPSGAYVPPTAPPSYDTVNSQPIYKVELGSYPHSQPQLYPHSQPYPNNESYPQNQRQAY